MFVGHAVYQRNISVRYKIKGSFCCLKMCFFTWLVGPACFQDLLLVVVYLPTLCKISFFSRCAHSVFLRQAGFGLWPCLLWVLVSRATTAGLERAVQCFLSAIWFPREVRDNDRGMLPEFRFYWSQPATL